MRCAPHFIYTLLFFLTYLSFGFTSFNANSYVAHNNSGSGITFAKTSPALLPVRVGTFTIFVPNKFDISNSGSFTLEELKVNELATQEWYLRWSTSIKASEFEIQGQTASGEWVTIRRINEYGFKIDDQMRQFVKLRVRACDYFTCGKLASSSEITPNVSKIFAAGAIAAKAGVNSGAATYHIPITLPPGRANMQPNISLDYSSSSGLGIAGKGWSLSGLSSISRCGATLAQDGFQQAPNYSSKDKLCLNGQRLILVNGTYGSNGASYRTEIDSFTSIKQVNSYTGSSAYFIVKYKNGRVAYFGKNTQSRVVHSGKSAAYSWMIEYEYDASGKNFIHYDYISKGDGEKVIDKIYYTGNSASSKGRNTIQFEYENKRQQSMRFISGGKVESTQRLKKVITKVSSSKVNSYELRYENNNANNTELLSSVEQCFAKDWRCMPATKINWHKAPIQYDVRRATDNQGSVFHNRLDKTYPAGWLPDGDRNGDGVRDWPNHYVDPEGNSSKHNLPMPSCNVRTGMMKAVCTSGDYNQDGLTDLWVKSEDKLRIGFARNSNTPLWYNTNITLGEYDTVTNIADYNGDGYHDIVVYRGTGHSGGLAKLHLYLNSRSQSASTFSESKKHELHSWSVKRMHQHQNSVSFPGDLDGDGTPDIAISEPVVISFSGQQVFTHELTKAIFLNWSGSQLNKSVVSIKFGGTSTDTSAFSMLFDVNGDGLMDWLGWRNAKGTDGNLHVAMNKGNRTFEAPYSLGKSIETRPMFYYNPVGQEWAAYSIPKHLNGLVPFDIDSDGKQELLMPGEIDTEYCIKVRTSPQHWATKCGKSLYSFYSSGATSRVNFQPGIDNSIYKYDAYHFVYNPATGKYAIEVENTDLLGQSGATHAIDAYGKGLTDLVFLYNNCGHDEVPCYYKNPVSGSKMIGKSVNNVYYNRNSGSVQSVTSLSSYQPNGMISSIEDGLGRKASWKLLPLSSSQGGIGTMPHYKTDHGYISKLSNAFHFSSSMYTVSRFEQSNGIGGMSATEFAYRGAVFDAQGRGFLGFRSVIEKQVDKDLVTQSDYSQRFPTQGKLLTKATFSASNYNYAGLQLGASSSETKAISHTKFEWKDNPNHYVAKGKVYHYYLKKQTTVTRDINNLASILSTQAKDIADIDKYGNERNILLTDTDPFNKRETRIENSFTGDEGTWWLNKLNSSKVTKYAIKERHANDALNLYSGDTTGLDVTTVQTKNWSNYHTSRKAQTYWESANSGLGKTVKTVINGYGLPNSVTTTAKVRNSAGTWVNSSRKETINYTSDGYFVNELINDKGHKVLTQTDSTTGLPKSIQKQIGENKFVTSSFSYDVYKRLYSEHTSGSPTIYHTLGAPDFNAPSHAALQKTERAAGNATVKTYIDIYNRVVRVATQNYAGDWIYVDTNYDATGNKTKESKPYLSNNTRYDVEYSGFDALGRPASKTTPQYCGPNSHGVMTAKYTYVGLTTAIDVDETCYGLKLGTMSRTYNKANQLIETKDADGNFTRYAYNSLGLPIIIRDANGNSIAAKYNGMGRKTGVNDPNQGQTSFAYNGFGELVEERRANNKTVSYLYDTLGRAIERSATSEGKQTFIYDTAENGIGQLAQAQGSDVTHKHSYDAYGRPITHEVLGDGQRFITQTTYDNYYGRVSGVSYPNGLSLLYTYDQYGYRKSVSNLDTGYVYQAVTKRDVLNNIQQQTLGNGLVDTTYYSSVTGQMTGHYTQKNGQNLLGLEYSRYDGFGNLKEMNIISGSVGAQHSFKETFEYDDLHRLNSNQVEGVTTISYGYDAIGNLNKKSDYASSYDYTNHVSGHSGGGPNAVKRVFKQGVWVGFSYDARGNMTRGDGLTSAIYNAMDKPTKITKNGVTSEFIYGPDQMRFMQVKGNKTIYYAGKHYELEVEGSKLTQRAYIDGIALVSKTGNAEEIRYMHKDRLGSARLMTDKNGQVVTERNFDPFGKPRLASGGLKTKAQLGDYDKAKTTRGFTDHEHLEELELIHMNGRIYDYNLGRFLSVDPVIQSPEDSQSINPYSYIMNNPLAGTDPTGYCIAKTGTRFARCGDLKVNVKVTTSGGGSLQASTVVQDVNFANHAEVKAAEGKGVAQIAGALNTTSQQMDMGGPQSLAQESAPGYSGTSGIKADNLEITGGDSSKTPKKTKRKEVKTLRSADDENEEDFLMRLSREIYDLSQETGVEHCANICTSGDQFSAEIYTDGTPLNCGVATQSCSSSNETPWGRAMHAHVKRFKITRELRKMYPGLWNSRK
ncbi:VCBS repeat-containing protein, partial [Pseudoalteromonas luteoviolacea]|uniref:SpvB/TcaC N-terminal domain-containing protein n=1 Tax=Pseudoalteromonas luteoviolacea TaxID=43657 RepID=UPI001B37C117